MTKFYIDKTLVNGVKELCLCCDANNFAMVTKKCTAEISPTESIYQTSISYLKLFTVML